MYRQAENTRPRSSKRLLARASLVVAVALAVLLGPAVIARADLEHTRVLLLGNSLSNGAKKHLRAIVESTGRTIEILTRTGGGWTLEKHATSTQSIGAIYAYPWDYVVLQEQSVGMFGAPNYYPDRYGHARILDGHVRNSGAETLFLMTWRDRGVHPVAYESLHSGLPQDPPGLGYVPIAQELGAGVAPVGWAYRQAVLDGVASDLWKRDGHHPSECGRYVIALALYTAIYGESPVGVWAPRKCSPEQVAYYQAMVGSVVFSEPDTWNVYDRRSGGQ